MFQMIRQQFYTTRSIKKQYYTTHFHFDNKLLNKKNSLIRKSRYILFHDEKICI